MKRVKTCKLFYIFIGLFIGFAIGFLFTVIGTNTITADTDTKEIEEYKKGVETLKEALQIIRENFVEEDKILEYDSLFYGAIEGVVDSLGDPYSSFLDEEEWQNMENDLKGSFVGIGIYIQEDPENKGIIDIISPIETSPAFRAGIKPGDKIVEIDGKTIKGNDFADNKDLIKGEEGTYVELGIMRIGYDEVIKLKVKREVVKEITVKGYMLDKKVGYVKITSFNEDTDEELVKTLQELKEKGIKSYILDLRDNPGGLLHIAVRCADRFLDIGKICYTRGRNTLYNSNYYAKKFNTKVDKDIPIVILINENSASASEIFTGALKDSDRAVVVGTKSYGKGMVQRLIPLKSTDNTAGLRLTIQKYFTPKGTDINKVGISPDIEVKRDIEYTQNDFFCIYKIRNTKDGKDLIMEFYTGNQDFTEKDISEFYKKLSKKGYDISKEILTAEILREKQKYSFIPYDLNYDIQLKTAYENIKKQIRE